MRENFTFIGATSLHLLGRQDKSYSRAELLDIPNQCEEASVLWHPGGHVVPMLTQQLALKVHKIISTARCSTTEFRATAPPLTLQGDAFGSSSSQFRSHVDLGEDDESTEEEFDSMRLLHETIDGPAVPTVHMYAVSMTMVLFAHSVVSGGMLNGITEMVPEGKRNIPNLHSFSVFVLLAGVWDGRRGHSWARLRQTLAINGSLLLLMRYSVLPEMLARVQATHLGHSSKQMTGRFDAPSWWMLAISVWQVAAYCAVRIRAPKLLLPLLSLLVHFGSFGAALPWPLRRSP